MPQSLMKYTIEQLIDLTEAWLVTGDLNPEMLSENFKFTSPFWKESNKAEFIEKFKNTSEYKDKALAKIVRFNFIMKYKSIDSSSFSIILQYHTKNGSDVDEAILGRVSNGQISELRSIYDLEETKKALEL